MGERTAAVALGVVSFAMLLIFVNGLVTALDETHPGNAPLTALRELIQGPAA